jgi:hypothetical protein
MSTSASWPISDSARQQASGQTAGPEGLGFLAAISVNGILASDRQRLLVLGMLLENLGIDKVVRFGRLEDWKAAIADLEKQQGSQKQP